MDKIIFSLTMPALPELNFALQSLRVVDQGLSQDYTVAVSFQCDQLLMLSLLLRQRVLLTLLDRENKLIIVGIWREVEQVDVIASGHYIYRGLFCSLLSELALSVHSRSFVQCKVVDVIIQLLQFAEWPESQWCIKTNGNYVVHDMMVQYNESDANFFQRILAEEGLFYTWIHQDDHVKLWIVDDLNLLPNQHHTLSVYLPSGLDRPHASVLAFAAENYLLPSGVCLLDYQSACSHETLRFEMTCNANQPVAAIAKNETRYGEKILNQTNGERLVRVRQQSLDWQREIFVLETDCPHLQPGDYLTLEQHPLTQFNRTYRIIEICQYGEQTLPLDYQSTAVINYRNQIRCIAIDIPYRCYVPLGMFVAPEPNSLKKIFDSSWPPEKKLQTAAPLPNWSSQRHQGLVLATIESPHPDNDKIFIDEQGAYRIRYAADENKTAPAQASAAAPLLQPASGEDVGFHFPLPPGTTVIIAGENGDLSRPLIIGALPHPDAPSPVTYENPTQNIIKTAAGHILLLDDAVQQEQLLLATPQQKQFLRLNADVEQPGIELVAGESDLHLLAQQKFMQISEDNQTQIIGGSHYVNVLKQATVKTERGDINLQAGKDMQLFGKNMIEDAQQNLVFHSQKNLCVEVGAAEISTSEGNIIVQAPNGEILLQAEKIISIVAAGKADINIAQAGAKVTITRDGEIYIKAQKIEINAEEHNLVGDVVHFGGDAKVAAPSNPATFLNWPIDFHYEDGSVAGFPIAEVMHDWQDNENLLYSETTNQNGRSHFLAIPPGKYSLQHARAWQISQPPLPVEIISVNGKLQAPWQPVSLMAQQHTTKVQALWPAILKSNVANDNSPTVSSTYFLTETEINYFKQQGNNVILFIHGFSVPYGEFSTQFTDMEIIKAPNGDDVLETRRSNQICTVLRTLKDLHDLNPNIPTKIASINGKEVDTGLNGMGCCNWLLHMEYNLNCAALKLTPNAEDVLQFPWEKFANCYTRIVGIHWPGNINFADAQDPATDAGNQLIPLLEKLNEEGITINIIAHSLGARVALTALQQLGQRNKKDIINNLFLWQAAVPDDALSPEAEPNSSLYSSYFPCAYLAAKKITILFSQNDWVLRRAYQAAMGLDSLTREDQLIWNNFPPGLQQKLQNDSALLQQFLVERPAMGYAGPRVNFHSSKDFMFELIKKDKLFLFDQGNLLKNHSDMKIPSRALFEAVYVNCIMNSAAGIKKFGKFSY